MSPPIPPPSELPARAPALPEHFGRRLCRGILRLAGWHFVGEIPNVSRLVLIVAPHSSWWDGIWGLLAKVGLGLEIRYIAKQELFHGIVGWLLRGTGGMPVDRASSTGVVEQLTASFSGSERLWLALAPEGTRRHVPSWKSGFWRIARGAGVPVFPVALHYPDKAIHLGPVFELSGDEAADVAALREFYRPFQGKYHGL